MALDKIFIHDLRVESVIGTRPEERKISQPLRLDMELLLDLSAAGRSDDLEKSVNYAELEQRLVKLAEDNSSLLLESLAERLADTALEYEPVLEVRLAIHKPMASAFGADIGVEIVRKRDFGAKKP